MATYFRESTEKVAVLPISIIFLQPILVKILSYIQLQVLLEVQSSQTFVWYFEINEKISLHCNWWIFGDYNLFDNIGSSPFVYVTWKDLGRGNAAEDANEYPAVWLRDNCQCPKCYNKHANARLLLMKDLDVDIKPKQVSVEENQVWFYQKIPILHGLKSSC